MHRDKNFKKCSTIQKCLSLYYIVVRMTRLSFTAYFELQQTVINLFTIQVIPCRQMLLLVHGTWTMIWHHTLVA